MDREGDMREIESIWQNALSHDAFIGQFRLARRKHRFQALPISGRCSVLCPSEEFLMLISQKIARLRRTQQGLRAKVSSWLPILSFEWDLGVGANLDYFSTTQCYLVPDRLPCTELFWSSKKSYMYSAAKMVDVACSPICWALNGDRCRRVTFLHALTQSAFDQLWTTPLHGRCASTELQTWHLQEPTWECVTNLLSYIEPHEQSPLQRSLTCNATIVWTSTK